MSSSVAIAMLVILTGCVATRPEPTPPEPSYRAPVVDSAPIEADETPPPPAPSTSATVESFLRASMEPWDSTPHVFGGMTISGADCSGFVVSLYRDAFGVNLPRTTRDQAHAGFPVSRDELAAGDLVFFRPGQVVNHVGIYLSEGRFAHISTSRGFIVSHMDESYWRQRYVSARRVLDTHATDSALLAWTLEDESRSSDPYTDVIDVPAVPEKSAPEQSVVAQPSAEKPDPPTSGTPSAPPTRRGGW